MPEEWREYFDRMQVLPGSAAKDVAHAPVVESFVQRAKAGQLGAQPARTHVAEQLTPERLQVAALLLVTAYRIAGSPESAPNANSTSSGSNWFVSNQPITTWMKSCSAAL